MEQHIIDTKQYIEQHKLTMREQHIIDTNPYMEQHNSCIKIKPILRIYSKLDIGRAGAKKSWRLPKVLSVSIN
jgi:hypothetical protein